MKITAAALTHRTTVYVLIAILVLLGVNSYRILPLESAPDVPIPIILVSVLYPGVAPADMETLVTDVLERELKELRDVKEITSSSSESISTVQIEFETEVDMDDAYQKVRDKVSQAKPDLPPEAEEPVLTEINVSEFPIMLINIFGDASLIELKNIAEDLEESIEQIKGVLNVDVTGGLEREIQVYVDPNRMQYYTVGLGNIIGRIQEEHRTVPGGNIDVGDSKYMVRVPGEYKNVKLMEDIVLKAPNGNPIRLKDIGRVEDGFKERETISRMNGKECVTLRVQKRAGENIVEIADEIKELMKQTEPRLPAGVEYRIRQDESKYVRDMVKDLENNIITGLLLVLLVLFGALGIRNSFFVAIAIPLSMLITFTVLRMLGITLNFVVLFSLILALGMLVDNSIVVVENIFRHAAEGADRETAALTATNEVAWAIIASTATTVAAFAPLLFWPGIMGDFMQYLPKTVIFALLASLFVALVINPVIASGFLKKKTQKMFDDSGESAGGLLLKYQRLLEWCVDHSGWVSLAAFILLVVSVMLYGALGAGVEFFPETTPDRAVVHVKAPQGTTVEKTNELTLRIEKEVIDEDNTQDLVFNVGFGGGMMSSGGSGNSHLATSNIEFKDRHERTHSTWDTIESIRKKLAGLSGGEFRVETEKHGPPTGDPVAIEISGPNYDILNRYATMVKKLIEPVPGVVDIKDDYDPGKPEIKVEVDREKAMLRKVNTTMIANAIRTAVNGTEASVLREGEDEYDIVVRYEKQFRSDIEDVLNIIVMGEDDYQIPLRDVARVYTTGGLSSVKHIDQKRTIKVSSDVMGRSSSEVLIDVQKLVRDHIEMPPGYFLKFSGESEEQEEAAAFLSEAFILTILVMALILITQFNSIARPLIILASVVMSMQGVLIGLALTQNKFGIIMTGMGIISLAGVVVNNAIVLIDYINQLRDRGHELKDALVRAGLVRFRPVLLTAITTVLGMAPMALGFGIDFSTFSIDTGSSSVEWWGPMAQAVIFGLLFATPMTLLLVPSLYMLQERLVKRIANFRKGREKDASAEARA